VQKDYEGVVWPIEWSALQQVRALTRLIRQYGIRGMLRGLTEASQLTRAHSSVAAIGRVCCTCGCGRLTFAAYSPRRFRGWLASISAPSYSSGFFCEVRSRQPPSCTFSGSLHGLTGIPQKKPRIAPLIGVFRQWSDRISPQSQTIGGSTLLRKDVLRRA